MKPKKVEAKSLTLDVTTIKQLDTTQLTPVKGAGVCIPKTGTCNKCD